MNLPRARTGHDQQLYSDFSDSDSDSLLSFSFKEDVRYPIHHPLSKHINDTTCHVLPCEFTSSANVLTSNTQADHDGPEARNSEPEVSADHHMYRCGMPSALNIASHSPILLFSNANRETDLDYDISLPRNLIELLPTADERFSSTTAVAPVLNIDCTSQTSSDCSSRSSLITNSDRTQKSQDTPVLLSDGENSRVRGLEQAVDSEAEDELELCIEWGDKGTGVLSPVRSKASPEPAGSDDRRGIQERRAMTEQLWQSDFLRGVSNSTGLSRPESHVIEEEDIGMSSDDGFDFVTSRGCVGLYSSGRPNVEMGMELDTEDEDEWDYGWSLQE
ncbi:hypothetical protein DFH11DRAFT_173350 [Phellopilus nigrolimitatus]|nr:hypothetical protein DFH11DRAFT_173350 [Phellopilus nigrolimitatus]